MIPIYKPYIGPEELEATHRPFEILWLGIGSSTIQLQQKHSEFLKFYNGVLVNSITAILNLALESVSLKKRDMVVLSLLTI